MKFVLSLIAAAFIGVACSSPQEKYDDQKMEAKKEYNKDIEQAEEEYEGDESDLRKDRAKGMVDDSEDVKVDVDKNKIDLQE